METFNSALSVIGYLFGQFDQHVFVDGSIWYLFFESK